MSFFDSIHSSKIIAFHDERVNNSEFPNATRLYSEGVWQWIENNHFNNASLWAEEDLARRTTVTGDEIAINKRNIDGFNQARNDATERVDEEILVRLGAAQTGAGEDRSHDHHPYRAHARSRRCRRS